MCDNASNNDTMLRCLADKLAKEDIEYNPVIHRLHCNGHIINLSVQAFLFETHPNAFFTTDGDPDKEPTGEELANWRKLGSLGKTYNLVKFILRTPQRHWIFEQYSNGLSLCCDNTTRWNSWYTMLDWMLRTDICAAIEAFCSSCEELSVDRLSVEDWTYLGHICNFLRSFHAATLTTEGHNSAIKKVLPMMDFLLAKYDKAIEDYKDDWFMLPCLRTGCDKLEKYYYMSDSMPVYITALVLHPCLKFNYIDKR